MRAANLALPRPHRQRVPPAARRPAGEHAWRAGQAGARGRDALVAHQYCLPWRRGGRAPLYYYC